MICPFCDNEHEMNLVFAHMAGPFNTMRLCNRISIYQCAKTGNYLETRSIQEEETRNREKVYSDAMNHMLTRYL